MKHSMTITVALSLVVGLSPGATAGSPALEVGSKAPSLSLTSADGTTRSLAEIDGPKVLIFYRGLW